MNVQNPEYQNQSDYHRDGRYVVVGPDGLPVIEEPGEGEEQVLPESHGEDPTNVAEMVEQPAKVMRIGSMIKQLLEEVRAAPLDEASRGGVQEGPQASVGGAAEGVPRRAELRIAQAQLVGWLEGLFHGIQTALFAQQMAARAQLEQMRRALPPGMMVPPGAGGDQEPLRPGSGPYL